MRNFGWIGAALVLMGASSVMGQEREASLVRLVVPGSSFDIMLAMAKNPTTTVDLGWSPDALVLHLIGGELAIPFENFETMFEAMNVLRSPVGASHVYDLRKVGAQPVALYVVPRLMETPAKLN